MVKLWARPGCQSYPHCISSYIHKSQLFTAITIITTHHDLQNGPSRDNDELKKIMSYLLKQQITPNWRERIIMDIEATEECGLMRDVH